MSDAIHRTAAEGFTRAAASYERGRPGYPTAAIDLLVNGLSLGPGKVVVEAGAGTGKFTRLLAPSGARIIAVEPVAEMRGKLSALLPEVEVLDATAESVPLPDNSVDAMVAAQAFHWFRGKEALAEFHRVLKRGGKLGLIWNRRDESVDWMAKLAQIVDRFEEGAPRYKSGDWVRAFDDTTLFGPLHHTEFGYTQTGTIDTVLERVASMSFIAAMSAVERERVLDEVRSLVLHHPATRGRERIGIPYRTDVYIAERL
ncbi:MAG TPA: methyltransferase domain-containing protein [Geobacteraceae bacterium]